MSPRNWSLRTKLTGSFLMLAVLALFEALLAVRTVGANVASVGWVEHSYQVIDTADQARGQLQAMRIAYATFVRGHDAAALNAYNVAHVQEQSLLKTLGEETSDNPPQVQRWQTVQQDVDQWVGQVVEPSVRAAQTSQTNLSQAAVAADQTLFDSAIQTLADGIATEQQLLHQRLQDLDTTNQQLRWVLLGGTATAGILAVVLAFLVFRGIGRGLGSLSQAARKLTAGELSERIEVRNDDEIGQTARAFNAMADRVQTLVSDLRDQVTQREKAEVALQAMNDQLHQRVTELELRDREAAVLAHTGELLQGCDSVDEAREVIAAALPRLFPDAEVSVAMVNESHNLVEVIASSGLGAGSEPFAPEDCWALRLGRPHAASLADQAVFCAHVSRPYPPRALCLPMAAQGRSLGLVQLRLPQDASASVATAGERLGATLADQVGLALSNLKLRETLRTQALRDPLTGLFNRRYLEETLQREISRAQRSNLPFSILMLDIDHFKRLNDTFGHQTGDQTLRQIGAVLMREIRAGDLACRYGGEEFTLVLPEASADNAARRAEHVRQAITDLPVAAEQRALGGVTVSIGVAAFPAHGVTPEDVLHAADTALYRAKRSGRNRVETAPVPEAAPVSA